MTVIVAAASVIRVVAGATLPLVCAGLLGIVRLDRFGVRVHVLMHGATVDVEMHVCMRVIVPMVMGRQGREARQPETKHKQADEQRQSVRFAATHHGIIGHPWVNFASALPRAR